MRRGAVAVLGLLAGGALAAPAAAPERVTFSRFGRDGRGASVEQVLDVLPDGSFTWLASSVGAACPGRGGRFQGSAPPDLRLRLGQAAGRLASDQKPRGPGPQLGEGSPGQITNTLELYREGRVETVPLVEYSEAWGGFEAVAAEVKSRSRPRAAVSLSAKRLGSGEIEVSFQSLGTDPIEVVLPRNASEAFSVGGAPARYMAAPARLRSVLSRSRPTVAVTLAAPAARGGPGVAGEVWYRNATILHHSAARRRLGQPVPPPLNLCAQYR